MIQKVAHDIWQIQGEGAGKYVTILGGTHGNERTGVEVVNNLKSLIESGELLIAHGTLTLIHGNPKAIEINERGSEPHADLNRSYPTNLLLIEPTGGYENARAREIAPFLKLSDVVVDLHATNKPSEPFVACVHSSRHKKVYQWFKAEKIVSDPKYVLDGESITTDEYAEAFGGIGLCYETGQASDLGRVEDVVQSVLNLLIDQGLVDGDVDPPSLGAHEVYELSDRIIFTEAGFTFEQRFGNRSWETFQKGDSIGHHGTVPLIASYDGVIVFPKIPEHRKVGKPFVYFAQKQ